VKFGSGILRALGPPADGPGFTLRQNKRMTDTNEPGPKIVVEDGRTGMHADTLRRAVLDHLYYTCMKDPQSATMRDVYEALSHAVRDRLVQRWVRTQRTYYEQGVKRVYYLSAEFLMGRTLGNNLINLGLYDLASKLLLEYGIDLPRLLEQELDPGLGNGGLGRLAACFLDSMATLGYPGYGYGIRYEFGIFRQEISDGWQVERGDAWLRYGTPWEIARHEYAVEVRFYGRVEQQRDENGQFSVRWVDATSVQGVPYDTPVAGFGNNTVNTLRLWAARATKEFDLKVFNDGDYRRAVESKSVSESISKVLYPNDTSLEGKELRLKQQYFFVCCSVSDILRRFKKGDLPLTALPDAVAMQLNDTHPAIAVAELMRVLVDQERMEWDTAWDITQRTLAFTNHTLLPEALETWGVDLFGRLLPRHLDIIFEINRRFLRQVEIHTPGDGDRLARMSIIGDGPDGQHVRMANLAVVGSHSVNGVAKLHSELITTRLMPDFASMWPERFNNKTNGVTPRRWILFSNPRLSEAITRRIGDGWVTDLDQFGKLAPFADDDEFLDELIAIKRKNKEQLAGIVRKQEGITLDVDAIFDVQIKRLHEYKRQLLNCLHVVALYQAIKRNPDADIPARAFLFGGKAAPGYMTAKLHIKLINDVAATINSDPSTRGRLQACFISNYGVSLAERIIPATDVSEQISMAGKEASGTGNMKFAMNGALTVGTLDGANVEIREAVGAENFFLFGHNAEQVQQIKHDGYNPAQFIEQCPALKDALDLVGSGFFSPDDKTRFEPIVRDLWTHDPYLVCADFAQYMECHQRVGTVYQDQKEWARRVVANLAGVGQFSSDRTIREYATDIWGVQSVSIELGAAPSAEPAQ